MTKIGFHPDMKIVNTPPFELRHDQGSTKWKGIES